MRARALLFVLCLVWIVTSCAGHAPVQTTATQQLTVTVAAEEGPNRGPCPDGQIYRLFINETDHTLVLYVQWEPGELWDNYAVVPANEAQGFCDTTTEYPRHYMGPMDVLTGSSSL